MPESPFAPIPDPNAVPGRRRGAALAGQVAGVAGIVICLLLIALVLLGRGWILGTVENVETAINSAIGRAAPAVARADGIVVEVGQRMAELATAADEVVAQPTPTPERLVPLQQRLSAATERYLALREAYASLRADVGSAVDRLAVVRSIVPGDIVPEGPVDALAAFDERVRALDERVMRVVNANVVDAAVDRVASQIATGARDVEASMAGASESLAAVDARLVDLQAQVSATASNFGTVVTIAAVVVILLLLYLAFLHLLLFRTSRRYGQPPAAA